MADCTQETADVLSMVHEGYRHLKMAQAFFEAAANEARDLSRGCRTKEVIQFTARSAITPAKETRKITRKLYHQGDGILRSWMEGAADDGDTYSEQPNNFAPAPDVGLGL